MRVRALFFAAYREWAGHDSLETELKPGATVADLVAEVRRTPGLDRLPVTPVVAVNEAYAELDQRLQEGDEVAFLPPVSGG